MLTRTVEKCLTIRIRTVHISCSVLGVVSKHIQHISVYLASANHLHCVCHSFLSHYYYLFSYRTPIQTPISHLFHCHTLALSNGLYSLSIHSNTHYALMKFALLLNVAIYKWLRYNV